MKKQRLIKISILILYALLMIYLVVSGRISKFINPRLVPLIIVCFILLLLSAAAMIIKKHTTETSRYTYVILIVPLILGFLFQPFIPASDDIEISSISSTIDNNEDSSNENDEYTIKSLSEEDETLGPMIENKKFIVGEKNYTALIETIYGFPDEFDGFEIEISGKVIKNENLKLEEFTLIRSLMVCCAADTMSVGFRCKYKNVGELKDDNWMKIIGEIETLKEGDNIIPIINVVKVVDIEPPKDEYLYP